MNRQFIRYLQVTLVIMDILVLNFSIMAAKYLLISFLPSEAMPALYNFWILTNFSWLLIAGAGQVYSEERILSFENFSRRTMRSYMIWVCMILLFYYLMKGATLSHRFMAMAGLLFPLGLLINRFIYLGLRGYFKNRKGLKKRVMILGYNETAKKLAHYLEEEGINTELLGYAENYGNIKEFTRYPVISEIKDTIETSKRLQVNEVLSTITPEQNRLMYDLLRQAEREIVRIRFIPDFSLYINKQVHVEYIRDIPILSLRSEPLEDVGNRVKKKALDLALSIFVTVFILSWLVPLLSVLIYLESRGPVFFIQMRSGKNNKPFKCLKFRSMRVNREADKRQATKNDARITRIGKFLRKTSLDEFPQFINVLRGEMSVVGPRPHMVKHTEDYSKDIQEYMTRHFLKPGITGLAQINGFRGEIKNPEQIRRRVEFDLQYLENWSLWLDIKIIFLTFYKIFQGDKQAY